MLNFTRPKIITVLVIVLAGIVLAIPNLFSAEQRAHFPSWLPSRAMTLGLDLQGGSHLLLEVDAAALRRERAEALRSDIVRVLRDERIGYLDLRTNDRGAQLRLRDPSQMSRAMEKLRELSAPLTTTLGTVGQNTVDFSSGANGVITATLTESGLQQRVRSAVDQSIEIIRRRVDQLGTTEPSIQRQGADRIQVQVPGLQDPQRLKDLIGTTAKLTFRMVDTTVSPDQAAQGRLPPELELLQSNDDSGHPYVVERRVLVAGEDLIDAQTSFDQRTQEPVVNFRFNTTGARRFGAATQQNVGRPFAIVLDDKVISAPVIREPILGGTGQISGSFTVQTANDLAILLRAGALPAPLRIVEERTVGPGLGQDMIRAGLLSAYIGSAGVVIFMILTYGLFGIFASLAVGINVAMIFGILSLIGATLTMPGIAGIVLTVGIAVDSNVLIYERIREEVRSGRSVVGALDAGFDRALATILDSNITTFLAAMVLFYVGTGAVRGFAVTLGVGIITTVFTAFTLTRLIVVFWYRRFRPRVIPI